MSTTTINFQGSELEVDYDYQPEESISSDREYGGCPAEVQIYNVRQKNEDITALISEEDRTKMEDKLLKELIKC